MLSSSFQSLLEENDMDTAKRSADLNLFIFSRLHDGRVSFFLHLWGLESASEGCRAHRGWISSPQLCKPSSGEGQLDSSHHPPPKPEVNPSLARLHWADLSKTNSCCYLSHLKTPGARASAGPLARRFGCWLHNEHSVPGGCVETVSREGFFFSIVLLRLMGWDRSELFSSL